MCFENFDKRYGPAIAGPVAGGAVPHATPTKIMEISRTRIAACDFGSRVGELCEILIIKT